MYINQREYFNEITKKYVLEFKKIIRSDRYLQTLARIDKLPFSRIYFGAEFCERLIPRTEDLKMVIDFCEKNDMGLTLLTPFVTDMGMEKLKKLFRLLEKLDVKGLEIVFNDWGVFRFIKRKYRFNLSIGRLLTKQKKDPSFIEDVIDKNFLNLDEDTRIIIKECSIDASPLLTSFILKNGISRIELDNVYQGIEVEFNIKKSLYYPFVPVTTTRFCKATSYALKQSYIRGKNPCNKECLGSVYSYTINNVRLFLKGNTQFYCNNMLPKNLSLFDRLVFEPPELFMSPRDSTQ